MAKKAFDLLPPYPKKEVHHHPSVKKKKEKKKSQRIFALIFFALLAILLFSALAETNKSIISNNQNASQTESTNQSFELFTDAGNSSFTQEGNITRIRILDATSDDDLIRNVRNTLLANGYAIERTTESINESSQTVIYFKAQNKDKANEIADFFKETLNPKLEQSEGENEDYDILILVGNK